LHNHPAVLKAGVRILIKREDTNHPTVSGNKWWKLKYNLEQAVNSSHRTVLTFGGAFSNHIYATAAACHELNLHCIGVIRGEEHSPLNPTLKFATAHGMKIHYVSRATYREKACDHKPARRDRLC
jgi:1-aminocyclopropane-1-carboxylate deaminase